MRKNGTFEDEDLLCEKVEVTAGFNQLFGFVEFSSYSLTKANEELVTNDFLRCL